MIYNIYMIKKEWCQEHPDYQLTYICYNQKCPHRLLCDLCVPSACQDQNTMHEKIQYDIKYNIDDIKTRVKENLERRLYNIMILMKERTQKYFKKIHQKISEDIITYAKSYYELQWNNQVIPAYIRQMQSNYYDDFDRVKLFEIKDKLKKQKKRLMQEDNELRAQEQQLINQIASSITQKIEIIQKIFWRKSNEKLKKSMIFYQRELSVTQIIQQYRKQIQAKKQIREKNLTQITDMIKKNNQINLEKLNIEKSYKIIYPIFEFMNIMNWNQVIKLSLKNCKLNYLEFFRIDNIALNNLKILDLGYNSLFSVDALIPINMPSLIKIHLEHNNLETIQPLGRAQWKNIKVFVLTYNKIKTIDTIKRFMQFKQLQQILLDGNMIESLKPLCNVRFPKITKIGIQIPPNEKLEELQFEDNQLKQTIWRFLL